MKQELFLNYKKAPSGTYIRPPMQSSEDSFTKVPQRKLPLPYDYLLRLRGMSPRRFFLT